MSSQWATTVLAMGLVATPAAVRAASDTETQEKTDIRCVALDHVPVEHCFHRSASRAVPSGEGELNQLEDGLEDRIETVQPEELWQ